MASFWPAGKMAYRVGATATTAPMGDAARPLPQPGNVSTVISAPPPTRWTRLYPPCMPMTRSHALAERAARGAAAPLWRADMPNNTEYTLKGLTRLDFFVDFQLASTRSFMPLVRRTPQPSTVCTPRCDSFCPLV